MEKKGFTGKLKNEFNESGNLEVYMPKLKGWFRVTVKEFRSFNGYRRVNGVYYTGPIYSYNTNNEIDSSVYNIGEICDYNFESKSRQYSAV